MIAGQSGMPTRPGHLSRCRSQGRSRAAFARTGHNVRLVKVSSRPAIEGLAVSASWRFGQVASSREPTS